jgi:FkbM family methyltransferase
MPAVKHDLCVRRDTLVTLDETARAKMPQPPSIARLLGKMMVDVVDVGANPIDGTAPYQRLLDDGLARLVGFEPNLDALAKLNETKGPNETYLPYAVADGCRHKIRYCIAPGMTSLLEPNANLYRYFHGFPDWGKVVSEKMVDTVRLDDVPEVINVDLLKIDIQGGELMAFQNARRLLAQCVIIQTEVEFLPLYRNQPLFSEVELFLRELGFIFHRFWPESNSRVISPLLVNKNIYAGLSQLVWADAVFVRDFTKLDVLSPDQLLRMSLIMHDVYGSFDLVLRLLMEYDNRCAANFSKEYLNWLTSGMK